MSASSNVYFTTRPWRWRSYRRQSTSREQVNRCHNLCGAAVRGRSRVMSVVKALSRANQPPARRRAARSTNKREVSMRKLVVLEGGRRCSATHNVEEKPHVPRETARVHHAHRRGGRVAVHRPRTTGGADAPDWSADAGGRERPGNAGVGCSVSAEP